MITDRILESSLPLIIFLQQFGDGFAGFMKVFTFLGNEEFYLFLFPILFWCIDQTLGFRAGLILLLSGLINSYFKWIFHLPRPYWVDSKIIAHTSESSFGAPSGHSQNAVAMWGLIATSIRKPWFWLFSLFVIFMIGLSRLVLGVHFLMDVFTGWLMGAVLLWIFLQVEPQFVAWFSNKKSLIAKIGILFFISFGFILVALLILGLFSDWEVPFIWIKNAQNANPDSEPINPLSLSGVITNAGVLFGLSSGYVILNSKGGFSTKAKFYQQFLKYGVGIIGVLLLWWGLDLIFPGGDTILGYIFRYTRYTMIGWWISLGAPLAFIKTRLSGTNRA
jgi:membrane-associated phospholipid phosphatase